MALKITGCHGFCEAELNIIIHPENIFYQKVQPKDAQEILTKTIEQGEIIERLLYIDPQNKKTYPKEKEIPFYTKQKRIVLGDNALLDPTDITDYFALGGYSALGKVLSTMSSEQVIESVKKSALRGRGGAGFPTGNKWQFTRQAQGEIKYVSCNPDEGAPGAYMDHSLMEGNHHRVLEGMIIGAYAIGTREGYLRPGSN
ncbi:MAG: hypothetical protein B5M54_09365 [Candidatus Aminicenantes bacterium 4484_214]|nr:MAG: hypothetical protein B5M54_09365 [Candidatus Aminicenantes bacterium 4484_214]